MANSTYRSTAYVPSVSRNFVETFRRNVSTTDSFWQSQGNQALSVMEQHLEAHSFFVGDRYTIADISLFAYTHVADAGGYDLSQFPAIQAWIERVKAQPRYIPLEIRM